MKMTLKEIEDQIKRYNSNCVTMPVFIAKANKKFLCHYFEGSSNVIRLYEEESGLNAVAKIGYRATNNSCYISNFETMYEFQGLGLGKFIYNLALAHADKLGSTSSYGFIAPSNEIKGVVENSAGIEEETKVLIKIYKRLGNSITTKGVGANLLFTCDWQLGERFDKLDNQQKEFVNKIIDLTKTNNAGV